MKKQKYLLTLVLLVGACPGADTAEAQAPGTVLAWGRTTTVPVEAQSGVSAIAAGTYHTVALKNDGSVVAWGDNANGETTVPVAAQSGVIAIAAGQSHTVALKNDGSVVAWGLNDYGQTTIPVAAQSGVTAMAAGAAVTVALKIDGSVVAWGENRYGQTTVPTAAQSGVTAIAVGGQHTVALKNDGSLVAWGANGYGEVTGSRPPNGPYWGIASPVMLGGQVLSGVRAIAAGANHTVALMNDGSVVAWGYNGDGQTNVPVASQSGVTAIAAGGAHTVALKDDGTVVAWGYNGWGETTVPAGLSGVTAIAAGGAYTVVLLIPAAPTITMPPVSQKVDACQSANFTVAAKGYSLSYQWRKDGMDIAGATSATYSLPSVQTNHAGSYTVVVSNPLGSVTSAPPAVLTVTRLPPTITTQPMSQTVIAWQNVSFAVAATGCQLSYQWRKDGLDIAGATDATYSFFVSQTYQAGSYTVVVSNADGSVTSAPPALLTVNAAPPPGAVVAWGQTTVPIAAQIGVMAIAAGTYHTVALKNDGSVVAWGDNANGETTVPVAAQSGVIAIAAGQSHTVALKNDGSVVAWGLNDYGQTTIPVAAQSGVTAMAAGAAVTVALKIDGSVVAWGENRYGQTTVPTAAQSGVTAIAVGGQHTVALKNDGSLVAWGANGYGEVTGSRPPNGPYWGIASPVMLGGQVLSGVRAIAAGANHTVALMNDGSVVAWGYNGDGQTNVPVASQSGVTAIAAGGAHTVALKDDGTVVAWGYNGWGETTVPAGLSGVTAIAAGGSYTVALAILTSPIITTQPVSQTVNVEQSVNFFVVATGNYLRYQWRKDGMDLAGATSPTYGLSLTQTNQAGSYTVVVSNPAGSVTSAPPAVLTVTHLPPTIITQPVSQTVGEWQSASFTVTATGYPLNYQWRKDGVDLAGATDASYNLTLTQTNQAGSYTVVVSNPAGSVTSAPPAVLTVNAAAPGTVVAWGYNGNGQTTVPPGLSGVTAIAAGEYHTVALLSNGSVLAWGDNGWGQTTVPFPAQSGVRAVGAGGVHTVGLKYDGSVVAWGANDSGQTTVPVVAQSGVTVIAAGGTVFFCGRRCALGVGHTVALKNDGSVVAWGWNDNGQTTVPVEAQSGVTAIAAGYAHTVALKNDGAVVAWGDNDYGQSTVPISAQSAVTAIAAGAGHTVALKNDGSVVAWGWNDNGQTTVPAEAQRGVTAIAAGQAHTVALKNDGTVVAWGYNYYDQTNVPAGLTGVTAIAAGAYHTVALLGTALPLPPLNARPSGNELILSWPTNAVGFTLQSTRDLTPPVTWMDSPNPPAILGVQFTVTNTLSGRAQFYRLRKL